MWLAQCALTRVGSLQSDTQLSDRQTEFVHTMAAVWWGHCEPVSSLQLLSSWLVVVAPKCVGNVCAKYAMHLVAQTCTASQHAMLQGLLARMRCASKVKLHAARSDFTAGPAQAGPASKISTLLRNMLPPHGSKGSALLSFQPL